MSTTAIINPRSPVGAPRVNDRPSFGRLTAVELRKMLDTRAGVWVLIGVLAITVITVVATALTSHPQDHTLRHIFGNALQPALILLPVVGILLVTSEWTQRTALSTFTLVPSRTRTINAKLTASAVVSVAPLVVAFALSVIATAIAGSGVHGTWTFPTELPLQGLLYVAISMITGVAFGALLLSSAPAMVLAFALPTAVAGLSSAIHAHAVWRWIDPSISLAALARHVLSGAEWAHVVTTLLLWISLPLAIGIWRVVRSEIK